MDSKVSGLGVCSIALALYTALETLLRMGRLTFCTAKAVDKELGGEEGKTPRPRGQEDPVISDENSSFQSLKSFLSYSEETFGNSVIRSRTSWVT